MGYAGCEAARDGRNGVDYHTVMTKPIVQSVKFDATAEELYRIYMDPKLHAEVTGGPVKISARPNSKFTAFGGMLWGATVFTVPARLIVQRWRSENFRDDDPDSILVLEFSNAGKRGQIDLVHVNVPRQDHAGVTDGWKKYYWDALRAYFKSR